MSFETLKSIALTAEEYGEKFWESVIREDMGDRAVTYDESYSEMRRMLEAMRQADREYDKELRSASGLAGGDGAKLEAMRKAGSDLVGDFISLVMEKAIKMAESNACMKRIVAAPTAGSCGVIPAVLLSYAEYRKCEDEKIVEALFVTAGIGEVIATRASISGAEGGCQAEIGSASAMAAGAIAYLEGGDNKQIMNAAALALKNMLGLTCDPVAGLVEVPCIKRNVSGAVNAVVSAQMSLAGIMSAIDPDEVIDSMGRIGRLLPDCLRETSRDGLAVTKSAMAVVNRMQNN